MRKYLILPWLATAACAPETGIDNLDPPDPEPPPGDNIDDQGNPPDWQDCFSGYRGTYANMTVDDSQVKARFRDLDYSDYTQLDWWDDVTFERFDASLDFGGNWWPVDEGLDSDPKYFAVRWFAWMRAWSNTTIEFTFGGSDDIWLVINDAVVASEPGIHPFLPQTYQVNLDSGQYPMEVLYAHRAGDSGMRFRVLSGDISICYPDYDSDEVTE